MYGSFEDEQVLDPGFKETLGDIARVARPFVHWCVRGLVVGVCVCADDCFDSLNDLMTVGGGRGAGAGSDEEEGDGDEDGDDEDEDGE